MSLGPIKHPRIDCGLLWAFVVSILLVTAVGCESKIEVDKINGVQSAASAVSLKPITAMPGDVVTITGSGFKSNRQKNFVKITNPSGDEVAAPATVTSDTAATFVMPEGVGLGLTSVVLESNGKQLTGSMPFVANLAGNALPILIDDAAEICSTKHYIDRNGDTQTGTKNCSGTGGTLPSCTADGVVGCVTTASFKSADMTNVTAGNIKSGVTIAGQAGSVTPAPANCSTDGGTSCVATASYPAAFASGAAGKILSGQTLAGVPGTAPVRPSDCSADGATGCVTTSSFKAADMTNVTAGNIKSGVTIAGQLGDYPSATNPLPGASGTADLDAATFNAKVKSSTAFEYWDSTGTRQMGAGDADITAANIASGVDIFSTTGTLTGGAAPNAWDLRVGVTVGGVTGKLKVNCRNRINSTIQNYDGPIGSIGQSGNTGGTVLDIWDTIDDYNNNASVIPSSIVTAWGSNTDCAGVEVTAGDDNVWKDVTTNSGGTASTCTADGARCTMQDKISGLWWSKIQSTGQAWNTALATCAGLTHNGQTGWRLPTQKELMDGYNHSIKSAASTNWITASQMNGPYFWSASSVSGDTPNAWIVGLPDGGTYYDGKVNAYQVVCVR